MSVNERRRRFLQHFDRASFYFIERVDALLIFRIRGIATVRYRCMSSSSSSSLSSFFSSNDSPYRSSPFSLRRHFLLSYLFHIQARSRILCRRRLHRAILDISPSFLIFFFFRLLLLLLLLPSSFETPSPKSVFCRNTPPPPPPLLLEASVGRASLLLLLLLLDGDGGKGAEKYLCEADVWMFF